MSNVRRIPSLTHEQLILLMTTCKLAASDERAAAEDASKRAAYFRELGDADHLAQSEHQVAWSAARAKQLEDVYAILCSSPERKPRRRR